MDIFYKMKGVSINGVNVGCSNINDFKFFKNSYHVEITFPNKNDNFLTAMFLLSDNLKLHNVTRFDILRIFVEKENLLPAININFKKNK